MMAESDFPPPTQESTTVIKVGTVSDEEPILYPTEEVTLEEQRRHFCLMLASEQSVPPEGIIDLASKFDAYLRDGTRPTKPRAVQ